jgi:hypothetical protein
LKKEQVEHAYSIDSSTGQILFHDTQGEEKKVRFSAKHKEAIDKGKKGAFIEIHNHPSSSSFSVTDLGTLSMFKSIAEIRVVGANGVQYTMSIGAGRRMSRHQIRRRYNALKSQINNYNWYEKSHMIIEKLAKEFGWEYKREET